MLLVPLEIASRGDQVHNAEAFRRQGWALVLRETGLSGQTLQTAISELLAKRATLEEAQTTWQGGGAAERLVELLAEVMR